MPGKRALIVDDSRSARVILGRMLESFGLQTDSAESAEQAFEYLQTARPDVIFMDHLMPGMDGFAAVKILKANPDTATIPVLMYTSQEGELYMGQARALGAVGVLPKTVKPVDLTRMLHQLHLLPDRRQQVSEFDAIAVSTGSHAAAPRSAPAMDTDALRLHDAELRNYIANGFEALARRMATDLKAILSTPPLAEATAPVPSPAPEPRRSLWPLWLAAGALLVAAIALPAYLNQRVLAELQATNRSQTQLTTQLAAQQQQLNAFQSSMDEWRKSVAAAADSGSLAPAAALLQTEAVPYGETPLAGARLERLRALIERLNAEKARGVLHIDSYTGDFCLTGNSTEGYSEATDDTPARRCDVVGNPFDDALSNPQRASVSFANYVATIPRVTGGNVEVAVNNGGRKPVIPYPPQSQTLTAGEWNRIAARNNRVEFSLAYTN